MQTVKTSKTSEKQKKAKSQNKSENFLIHSKLVEQELMTSHEYEQLYYNNNSSQAR